MRAVSDGINVWKDDGIFNETKDWLHGKSV